MSKLAIYKLADLVKAQDGSEVTLNDLQSQVSTLAQSDSRFNNKPAGTGDKNYASIWVCDILTDGSDFKAVISAMDGKYYEVGINVADGKVTSLNTDATEVVRKTMYVASRGKGLCFNSETVEGEITAGGPGSGPHAGAGIKRDYKQFHEGEKENEISKDDPRMQSGHEDEKHDSEQDLKSAKTTAHAKLAFASYKAHSASEAAYKSGKKEDHEGAMLEHEEASQKYRMAGDEGMSRAHSAHASVHESLAGGHDTTYWTAAKNKKLSLNENPILHCRDTGIPIVLASGKEWKFGEATDFQWMPGGLNNIVAGTKINGEDRAVDLWLDCNETTAKTVKASFAAAVKRSPRRPPFGCVEHHEEEKAFEPQDFAWKNDPEPGVYCTAKPTGLGETNVNKRLHTSFSPSFGTNADYTKAQCRECDNLLHGEDACVCGGTVYFPDGVKGSESNPASVVAVSPKSVGSLTNWPAFKNILPVTAKEPGGKKTLTPMETIYAKEAEKQKLLDEIRAKNCAPEAPKNPVMEKLYALNGMNS